MEGDAGGPRLEEDGTLQEAPPCQHEDLDSRQQLFHLPGLVLNGKAGLGLCPLSRGVLLVTTNPGTWAVHSSPLRTAWLTPVKSRKRGKFGEPFHLLPLPTLSTCLAKGATVLLSILFLHYFCV